MFGFGKGKIELVLPKTGFKPGEEIKGKLILSLKKPVQARELRLLFYGERIINHYDSRTGRRETTKRRFYEFKLSFGGEKTYTNEEHEFSIKVPEEFKMPTPEGVLGTAVGVINALSKLNSRVEFWLDASLDIPKGFDVNKKQIIYVEGF